MAKIPRAVLKACSFVEGLILLCQGKVRDTYLLPDHPEALLVVASDRISIFDFVLNLLIPLKGEILNALNIFWRLKFGDEFKHDLLAYGAGIDAYLPKRLRNNPELQKRAIVVKRLNMVPVEGIVRGYLLGSGLEAYNSTSPHAICGITLPDGLVEGSEFPTPIFTPTNKAEVGHDVHITAESVQLEYPGFGAMCTGLFTEASRYAISRGMIVADTKFEGSIDTLGDEWLTQDSSRIWLLKDYEKYRVTGKLPQSLDKQRVRNAGKLLYIDKDESGRKRDPEDPKDLAFVHSQVFPISTAQMTTGVYRFSFWALTGQKIEDFQRQTMGITVAERQPRIEVLVGSKSDLPQTVDGRALLEENANVRIRVMSCDRNPIELADAAPELAQADVIIAGAGMSARLPSAVKSQLCAIDHPEVPVIGVAFEGNSDDSDDAALLAISQVPGQPVVMDSFDHPYFGAKGFTAACKAVLFDEFLPKDVQKKPVELVKDFSRE